VKGRLLSPARQKISLPISMLKTYPIIPHLLGFLSELWVIGKQCKTPVRPARSPSDAAFSDSLVGSLGYMPKSSLIKPAVNRLRVVIKSKNCLYI
jgi:hypothetical protein